MLKSTQEYYSYPLLREFVFLMPPLFHWRHSAIKELLHVIKSKNLKRVIEIGCGTGFFTRKLSRLLKNTQITAIDPSHKMIDIAKRAPIRNVRYIVSRIEDIDEKFDGLVALHVFQILPLSTALKKAYQLLEQKGTAFLTLTSETIFTRIHKTFFEMVTDQRINLYHPDTFKSISLATGFNCQIKKISYTEGSYLAILTK